MAISDKNDRLTVIISKELKNKLKKMADEQNRSLSNYVVTILETHALGVSIPRNEGTRKIGEAKSNNRNV